MNDWCPGYWNATEHQHDVCWLRLLGGLIKFESSFKPDDAFKEPSGNWSVGLMALSPNECKGYETVDLLKQPLLNLSCGIGKFAQLVAHDGYIAGPAHAMGAAAYWSTLRAPYVQQKPDGNGFYHLGKKLEILPYSTAYRNY
ncbi:MAG: transglycosylase SLT domain-containing protein [Bdellovibrionota bacterium]